MEEKSEKLFIAIKEDRFEDAYDLLKDGADPNSLLLNGVTPFHFAIGAHSTSSYNYVKLILQFNGNANVRDPNGLTPFHVAADWGKADCLDLLLRNGADIALTDKDGKDVYAFAQGNENCMLILKEFVSNAYQESNELTNSIENKGYISTQTTPLTTCLSCGKVKTTQKKLLNCSQNDTDTGNITLTMDKKISQSQHFAEKSSRNDLKTNIVESADAKANRLNMETSVTNYKDFLNPADNLLHTGLDATSPDNCFLFIKPEHNKNLKLFNKTINIKVLPETSSTVKSCDSDSFCSLPNQTILLNSRSDYQSFENITLELSTNSLTNESTPELASKCVLPIPDTPKTTKDQSITDEIAMEMLMSTKRQIFSRETIDNGALNNISKKNVKRDIEETSIPLESLFTTADTTVPLLDTSNASLVGTCLQTDVKKSVEYDKTNKKQIPVIENKMQETNIKDRLESTRLDEIKSSSSSFEISIIKVCDEVVFCDEDGLSLVEDLSPPVEEISWNNGQTIPLKLSISCEGNSTNDNTILYDWKNLFNGSAMDVVSHHYSFDSEENVKIPDDINNMSDDKLRNELIKHGVNPGPIQHARKLYKKKLHLLEQGCKLKHTQNGESFSHEVRSLLRGNRLPDTVVQDDKSLRQQFDDPTGQNLRGGMTKDSFNYLLLDPRITGNLPNRAKHLSENECLKAFVSAIFYVGKGKKTRPYDHFKEAIKEKNLVNCSKKIQHIHNIWNANCGVISLHVFQNVMACEAYTREAAMIEALGLNHLTNKMKGKTYGDCSSWDKPRLKKYGAFLILSSMQIFLLEGERQIRQNNIKKNVKKRNPQ